ncbi:MAG: hypothetical protein ACLRWM_05920 [Streptococcus sp.]
MRGKKPKERKNYILRTENGTLVEVTREVYLEWYQSRRRENTSRNRNRNTVFAVLMWCRKAVLQKLLYRRKDSRRRWQYAVNA